MGVDTKAKITGNPSVEELVEGIKTLPLFSNVEITSYTPKKETLYTNNDGEEASYLHEAMGWISFDFDNGKEIENRQFFFIEDTKDKSPDSSLVPFTTTQHLYLSLGAWGASVEIMNEVASVFGGIVIPDDCADEEAENFFHIIDSKNNFVLEPTIKELFDTVEDMNPKEKFEFIKNISTHKTAIEKYLTSQKVV